MFCCIDLFFADLDFVTDVHFLVSVAQIDILHAVHIHQRLDGGGSLALEGLLLPRDQQGEAVLVVAHQLTGELLLAVDRLEQLRLFKAIDGQKEFAGELAGYDKDNVVLLIAGEEKPFARKAASLIKPVVDMDGVQDVDMGDSGEDMNVGDEIEIGEE